MPLFKKVEERFEPNCEFDEDTGEYFCQPVLEVGGKVISAKEPVVVKWDEQNHKIKIKRAMGVDEKLLDRLLDHFENRKVV